MTLPGDIPPARGLTLRGILTALGIGTLLYVGVVGLIIALRVGPETRTLQGRSAAVLTEFTESRRRAGMLDATITDLWRRLGIARTAVGPIAVDTLERHRLLLQAMLDHPRSPAFLRPGDELPRRLQETLTEAVNHEAKLGGTLLAAVAALELGETDDAESLLRHADSLDAPLTNALAFATVLALEDVNRHEADLAATARLAARSIGIWLGIGLILAPILGLLLHHRLYGPLARLDQGLSRIAAGDLSVTIPVTHTDELGRLSAHFNRVTTLLRQRAADDAERAATRSALRTRQIVEAALDAVIVFDDQGLIREWSPTAASVFGWTRAEAMDRSLLDLVIPPHERDTLQRDLEHLRATGEAGLLNRRVETELLRHDGTLFPAEVAVTPLERSDGRLEFSAFIRDITERHQAQAALSASEARYRLAFEQAAVGMVEVTQEGLYRRVNRTFATILGYEPEELEGKHLSTVTPLEDGPQDEAALQRLFASPTPFVQREKRYRRRDGTIAWTNIAAAVIRGNGEAPYAVSVVQDLTERKRLEEELRQSQKMEAIGRLAGGVAHDFNNLLTAIVGHAFLAATASDDAIEVRQHAAAIQRAADRGADLSRSLLAFARRTPIARESVLLEEVAEEATALLRRTIDRRITVTLSLATLPSAVLGDRNQLVNAVLNLALNARDAMQAGGVLAISTDRRTPDAAWLAAHPDARGDVDYATLTVRDSGVGMSAETLTHIFEPFFTTKPVGEGTGLGLAMVYGTVRSHDGILGADSAPGEGTTITIALPVAAEGAPVTAPHADQTPLAGRGRILLADDETMVREVGAQLLSQLGYDVEIAVDGADAVAQVVGTAKPFDLVILDGNMPVMTGQEACVRIRAIDPEVPLILASGYVPDGEEQSPVTEEGFDAVILKPYSVAALSRLIAAHLRRPL